MACSKPCDQCLFSDNMIVDEARKQEIINSCLEGDKHFICHKGTLAGVPYDNLVCYGWLKKYPGGLQLLIDLNLIHYIEPMKLVEK